MKHFKKIESKFLFSLLIMSVWSIIAVGQTTAKISKYIPHWDPLMAFLYKCKISHFFY